MASRRVLKGFSVPSAQHDVAVQIAGFAAVQQAWRSRLEDNRSAKLPARLGRFLVEPRQTPSATASR